MSKRSKAIPPAPVELNGNDILIAEPPDPAIVAAGLARIRREFKERFPPKPPTFLTLTSKRKHVVQVRISAIDALWRDDGSLDGPFFVQAGGRTFHPNEESFVECSVVLGISFEPTPV